MQACLRELVWVLSTHEAEVKVLHIDTNSNRLADLLSRWELSPTNRVEFADRTRHLHLTEVTVDDNIFLFEHSW